jgi:hypothetical protein
MAYSTIREQVDHTQSPYPGPGRATKLPLLDEDAFEDEEEAIKKFSELMNEMRSQDIGGILTTETVTRVLWQLTERWKHVAEDHINSVIRSCEEYFQVMIPFVFQETQRRGDGATLFKSPEIVAERLFQRHLKPALEKKKSNAFLELARLEEDRMDICENVDSIDGVVRKKLKVQGSQISLDPSAESLPMRMAFEPKLTMDPGHVVDETQEDSVGNDVLKRAWLYYKV